MEDARVRIRHSTPEQGQAETNLGRNAMLGQRAMVS